ncbi:hypothetical protein [Parasphingopyxis lamellibrachiae]|uniref:Uncharacterized protein n=1 Tax=Parasphingopyxis lamellibrachiae TaxID=680125 RepID=A0A3D9FEB7_9SPHN|nr:hypothetical protein [Parasphingopyxis lamellibrachiae]RED15927.1 hypothetical protein DFR46_0936 [Parasphingopyxis lamellibrachiae]
MKFWKTKSLMALGVGVSVYALIVPAFGQDAPESLLPEGFGDPVAPTPAPPPPPPAPTPSAPAGPTPSAPVSPSPDREAVLQGEGDIDEFDIGSLEFEDIPPEYELPPQARRSLALVGPLTPGNGGYGEEAFAGADGRYISRLMRELDAPGPSRWMHISLRRALLSHVPTPNGVVAPDWIAERAWLLLRMGEVDGARMLVQRVDSDRHTPKLYAVAMQTSLAAVDPAGFCPLVTGARRSAESPAWIMADAICAGLGGESARATTQMAGIRDAGLTNGFDVRLGDRAVNAGGSSSAIPIDWAGVEQLNAWRFGIANATGAEIPDTVYATAGRQVAAWRARTPTIDLAARIAPARTATVMGVLSNQALVSMYSALLAQLDPTAIPGSTTDILRTAYVEPDEGERIAAMQTLWTEEDGVDGRYAGLILTARAAARIRPVGDHAGAAQDLIAAMMAIGLDLQAARWASVVDDDESGDAWALLAVGAPQPVVGISFARLEDYAGEAGAAGRHRARLLAAALAGLGLLNADEIGDADRAFGLNIDEEDIWSRQLERVARGQRVGLVALISAIGMQADSWSGIPPRHLYHIVRAYRLAGREPEARMIAAEAVTRA